MTVTVRAIATRDIETNARSASSAARSLVGLVNGVLLALAVGAGAALWFGERSSAACWRAPSSSTCSWPVWSAADPARARPLGRRPGGRLGRLRHHVHRRRSASSPSSASRPGGSASADRSGRWPATREKFKALQFDAAVRRWPCLGSRHDRGAGPRLGSKAWRRRLSNQDRRRRSRLFRLAPRAGTTRRMRGRAAGGGGRHRSERAPAAPPRCTRRRRSTTTAR